MRLPFSVCMVFAVLLWSGPCQANEADIHEGTLPTCHFMRFYPNTLDPTDPVKRVSGFIVKHWLEIETELAREPRASSPGRAISYLQQLALCPYSIPKGYWRQALKGKPLDDRPLIFTEEFVDKCFCR